MGIVSSADLGCCGAAGVRGGHSKIGGMEALPGRSVHGSEPSPDGGKRAGGPPLSFFPGRDAEPQRAMGYFSEEFRAACGSWARFIPLIISQREEFGSQATTLVIRADGARRIRLAIGGK